MYQHTNDLEQRTLIFSINTSKILRKLPITIFNKHIITQLLRSSSSIGANYHEARESESRNDFIHKLSIAKKEANETLYWINIMLETENSLNIEFNKLKLEAQELLQIISASIATSKKNSKLN